MKQIGLEDRGYNGSHVQAMDGPPEAMIRLLVVLLLAANLLLIGLHVASESPKGDRPVANLSPIPPGTPTLKLLEELAPEAYPEAAARRCYSAGPFETVPSMIQAREALGPNAEDVTERDTEALVELGYWVSLPPVGSFQEAGEQLRLLNQAGLQDVAVLTDELGDHYVSLGYFLEEANARRRRDEVRDMGFEVETRLKRETQMRFWLDYAFTDQAWAERAASALSSGQQREVPCT